MGLGASAPTGNGLRLMRVPGLGMVSFTAASDEEDDNEYQYEQIEEQGHDDKRGCGVGLRSDTVLKATWFELGRRRW